MLLPLLLDMLVLLLLFGFVVEALLGIAGFDSHLVMWFISQLWIFFLSCAKNRLGILQKGGAVFDL